MNASEEQSCPSTIDSGPLMVRSGWGLPGQLCLTQRRTLTLAGLFSDVSREMGDYQGAPYQDPELSVMWEM